MTRADVPSPSQPDLADLMLRYLRGRSALPDQAPPAAEVEPFEVPAGFRIDPRLAWDDARAALILLGPAGRTDAVRLFAAWAGLVSDPLPQAAVPMCAGNFPQLVRDLTPLLQAADLSALRPEPPATIRPAPELRPAKAAPPEEVLLRAGAMRLAGDLDGAAELLGSAAEGLPEEWRAALANERAALLWHRGRAEEAAREWAGQAESVPVLFNRGLAALFAGRPAEARGPLARAAEQLPESGGWHHLARLYLALAEARR
ncbi:MAG TPA: hypothetical protein VIL46_14450 [Gemmataceae bacterium]